MSNDNILTQNIPNILIVDDVPANLLLLGHILRNVGYKVRPVPNGALALKVAEKEKPDLILLDIMMPDMDGFEVCQLFKENKNLNDVPIIFISALNETQDIVKALTCGGADYIAKPFQAEEVKARVATHLKLYQQNKELQKINAEKEKFFSIITNNPNLFSLLDNLLEWAKIQQGLIPFFPKKELIKPILEESIALLMEAAKKKDIEIDFDLLNEIEVFADKNMLQKIILNLVFNAIKYTPKKGIIKIEVKAIADNSVEISVKDSGIGMDTSTVDSIFRIDSKIKRDGTDGEPGTGLGLLLCKELIEKQGGKIWAESEEGKGSVFYFTIPSGIY